MDPQNNPQTDTPSSPPPMPGSVVTPAGMDQPPVPANTTMPQPTPTPQINPATSPQPLVMPTAPPPASSTPPPAPALPPSPTLDPVAPVTPATMPATIPGPMTGPVAAPRSGMKKSLVAIVIAALVGLLLLGAGVFFLLGSGDTSTKKTTTQEELVSANNDSIDVSGALTTAELAATDLASNALLGETVDTTELETAVTELKDAVSKARISTEQIGQDKTEVKNAFVDYVNFADASADKLLILGKSLSPNLSADELLNITNQIEAIIDEDSAKVDKIIEIVEKEGLN